MGFLRDLIALAKETPDQRRKRESQGRVITTKRKPPPAATSHPDDHYGFAGWDKWSEKRKKATKGK